MFIAIYINVSPFVYGIFCNRVTDQAKKKKLNLGISASFSKEKVRIISKRDCFAVLGNLASHERAQSGLNNYALRRASFFLSFSSLFLVRFHVLFRTRINRICARAVNRQRARQTTTPIRIELKLDNRQVNEFNAQVYAYISVWRIRSNGNPLAIQACKRKKKGKEKYRSSLINRICVL